MLSVHKNFMINDYPTCIYAQKNTNDFLVGTKEGNLIKYNFPYNEKGIESKVSDTQIECIIIDSKSKIWISGSNIQQLSLSNFEQLKSFNPHTDIILGLFIQNKNLISISEDGSIKSTILNEKLNTVNLYTSEDSIIAFDLHEESNQFILSSTNQTLVKFDLIESKNLIQINSGISIWSLKFIDKQIFASGDHEGTLKICTVFDLKCFIEIKAHESRIKSIDYNNEEGIILTGSFDCKVKVFRYDEIDKTKQENNKFIEHEDWVRCARFAGNREIISISDDMVIKVCELYVRGSNIDCISYCCQIV